MKYKNFIYKKLIDSYFQKHYALQQAFYSIVKIEKHYLFFKRWTVMFYDIEDLRTKIKSILTDLLEKEFKIKITKIECSFFNIKHDEIQINLATNNDNLLIGKFGQNQKSLVGFVVRSITFFFKKKYEILLNFNQMPKKYPSPFKPRSDFKPWTKKRSKKII